MYPSSSHRTIACVNIPITLESAQCRRRPAARLALNSAEPTALRTGIEANPGASPSASGAVSPHHLENRPYRPLLPLASWTRLGLAVLVAPMYLVRHVSLGSCRWKLPRNHTQCWGVL